MSNSVLLFICLGVCSSPRGAILLCGSGRFDLARSVRLGPFSSTALLLRCLSPALQSTVEPRNPSGGLRGSMVLLMTVCLASGSRKKGLLNPIEKKCHYLDTLGHVSTRPPPLSLSPNHCGHPWRLGGVVVRACHESMTFQLSHPGGRS
jgi:hypothetical protein